MLLLQPSAESVLSEQPPSSDTGGLSYAQAGVAIDAGNALVKAIKSQPEVRAFAESPLLRYSTPLLLDNEGRTQLDGRLWVQLDRELGLLYQSNA